MYLWMYVTPAADLYRWHLLQQLRVDLLLGDDVLQMLHALADLVVRVLNGRQPEVIRAI